ncbi:MAG: protein kinase [Deltaproteobacteria bacterium]|jgi:serine/threonine protein kinase|nr:protein kinase [Deltaproteobacteria bacterium]
MSEKASNSAQIGTAYCPKCQTGYKLNDENMGRRSICVKCGQNFHLLPQATSADTKWLNTTAALNDLATRVWEKGLDLRVGQVILGVYVVQEILGRGGLGQVFKVRHQEWRKELALKLPLSNATDPQYFKALRNEAETWVSLGLHPHVVTCYYVRPLMGVPSIFMEYISGGSLKEMMEPKGQSPPALYKGDERERSAAILDAAIQTAWGLDYAHSRGVLHLDIKPQNLLLEEDTSRLLVTDFGLARASRNVTSPSDSASLWPKDQKALTETPNTGSSSSVNTRGGFGTPQYMSPESKDRTQPAVSFDLWALSLTILELFLGRRPWEYGGAVSHVLDQYIASVKPVTSLPPQIMSFLRRALDPDPTKRFQRALDVSQELIKIYSLLLGLNYPRPRPKVSPDSADNLNNRAISLLDLGHPDEAEKLWRQALKEEPQHSFSFFNFSLYRFHAKTISPETFIARLDDLVTVCSGQNLTELPLMLAGAYLELGQIHEAAASLASFEGPALNSEARRLNDIIEQGRINPNFVERYKPAIYRISKISSQQEAQEGAKALSPLLKKAAEDLEKGSVIEALKSLTEAKRLKLPNKSAELDNLWRSLYGFTTRTELRDALLERVLRENVSGEEAAFGGQTLVLADQGHLKFVKAPQSQTPQVAEVRLASHPAALAINSEGTLAAILTKEGHLWLFNPATGAGAGQAKAYTHSADALVFKPDSRKLFTSGDNGELKMWDTSHGYLDKGAPLLVRKLSDLPLQHLLVSPNGRILSATDGLVEFRISCDKPASPSRSLPMAPPGSGPRTISAFTADPFNRYLVAASESGLSFHPLFNTDWRADLSAIDSPVSALAISPDSRLWAAALLDGRLLLGQAPDERKHIFLVIRRLEAGLLRHLSFTSDGAFLLAVGQSSVSVYGLDWNLELAKARSWDKKADLILHNFIAKQADNLYDEAMADSFIKDLSAAGLVGLERSIVVNRLKEAVQKQRLEY